MNDGGEDGERGGAVVGALSGEGGLSAKGEDFELSEGHDVGESFGLEGAEGPLIYDFRSRQPMM